MHDNGKNEKRNRRYAKELENREETLQLKLKYKNMMNQNSIEELTEKFVDFVRFNLNPSLATSTQRPEHKCWISKTFFEKSVIPFLQEKGFEFRNCKNSVQFQNLKPMTTVNLVGSQNCYSLINNDTEANTVFLNSLWYRKTNSFLYWSCYKTVLSVVRDPQGKIIDLVPFEGVY